MWIINRVLDLIFPPKCVFCGEICEHDMLCDKCKGSLEIISPSEYQQNNHTKNKLYKGVIPSFYYHTNARNAIARLKFKGNKKCSEILAVYMEKSFREFSLNRVFVDFDIIIPVPMHKSAVRARGYNQSELLAGHLSKRLDIEMRTDILQKTKKNRAQHNLSKDKREGNVDGVYSVAKDISLNGERILLVDDVLTTGNTANECTKNLIEAGAGEVWVAVATTAEK